ncbi:hypothetical protein K438DRAFT_1753430 [Mycena galopus ATCC 62051]|nr:hypothetical protein K438DRAFT_1753430 [Mycena galopus ATCC 62051]
MSANNSFPLPLSHSATGTLSTLGLRPVDPYPFYGYGTGIDGSPVLYPSRSGGASKRLRPGPLGSNPAVAQLKAGNVAVIILPINDFTQPVKPVYGRVRVTRLRVYPTRRRAGIKSLRPGPGPVRRPVNPLLTVTGRSPNFRPEGSAAIAAAFAAADHPTILNSQMLSQSG